MGHQAQVQIMVASILLCVVVSVPTASAQQASSQQMEEQLGPCLDCHSHAGGDPYCAENHHRAPGLMPPGESGWGEGDGTHSACKEGSCITAHGYCFIVDGSGDDLLSQLSVRVSEGTTQGLMEAVRMLEGRIVLNVARSAIQVHGCEADGGFVGHFPLSAVQLANLKAMMGVTVASPGVFATAALRPGTKFEDR